MWYSASTRGFYRSPPSPDAVEISEDHHASLLAAQIRGLEIVPDEHGFPIAEDAQATANALWLAQSALDASDRVVLRCYEAAQPVPKAWVTYRQALRDLITSGNAKTPLPVAPAYPAKT